MPGVVVGVESLAATMVRSGKSPGGDSFFSAGSSALIGAWLVSDGPSAGPGGSAIRLFAANCSDEESLSAVAVGAGGDAACVADCCATLLNCWAFWFTSAGDGGDSAVGEASAVSGTPITTPNGFGWRWVDRQCGKKNALSAARSTTEAARARAGATRFFPAVGNGVGIATGPKLRVKAVCRSAFCKHT